MHGWDKSQRRVIPPKFTTIIPFTKYHVSSDRDCKHITKGRDLISDTYVVLSSMQLENSGS